MTALNNAYGINSTVRASVVFTVSTVATNPTEVYFTWRHGRSGTVSTYTYGTDAELVRDSTGHYHVDIAVGNNPGTWYYGFQGTSACAAQGEGKFFVRPSDLA